MTSVQQTGSPTPYHLAQWVANGVIGDGGAQQSTLVIAGKGTNFNTTSDQPIVFPQNIVAFRLANIIITNASLNLSAAAGGFYPAASKAGTPIVAASQTYSALTTATDLMTVTLASFGTNTRFSSANLGNIDGLLAIWFSLTTPQGAPVTADIFFAINNLS